MTPDWLNDSVQAFGRQMGLREFRLKDRDTAGVTFENGRTLRLEYASEALMMLLGFPVSATDDAMKQVLMLAHPAAQRQLHVRAGYLARTGEALLVVRLAERDVSVTTLETAFRALWNLADSMRRVAS